MTSERPSHTASSRSLRYWRIGVVPALFYGGLLFIIHLLRYADKPMPWGGIVGGAAAFGLVMALSFYWLEQRAIRRLKGSGQDLPDDEAVLAPIQNSRFSLPGARIDIFHRVRNALIDYGALIEAQDETTGELRARTPQSWKSYGETLTATISTETPERCSVQIASKPRMWLTNRITNYGKSYENVNAIRTLLITGHWPVDVTTEQNIDVSPASRPPPPAIFEAGSTLRLALIAGCYLCIIPSATRSPEKMWVAIAAAIIGITVEAVAYYHFRENVKRGRRSAIQEQWEAVLMNVWMALFLSALLIQPSQPFYSFDNLFAALLVISFVALAYKRFADGQSELVQRQVLERDRERADLQRQLAEAKLVALSAQIEPHFLFNTLASIQYLIRHDSEKANAMVSDLIRYLRLALPRMKQATAPLADELELVRAYLGIMQIRMGERLTFSIRLDGVNADTPTPTMTLITLVENAIKHGLERKPEGGRIDVLATCDPKGILLTVADTGGGFNGATSGTGIGLANIRERLSALYGTAGSLTLTNNLPTGVLATIRHPSDTPTARDVRGDATAVGPKPTN